MTFRIWKSSGLINHLFFSPLFLLTPLFFEHQENLSVPLFAPRTPFSQVSSSLAHGLVAYRFAARSRTSRSPRLAATPSAVALSLPSRKNQGHKTPMPSQATSCLAHGLSLRLSPSASLRHRLFVGFGRNMPSASSSLAAPLPSSGKH